MRALKVVIDLAGKLKEANWDEKNEWKIIVKALIDVNMPKFVRQD